MVYICGTAIFGRARKSSEGQEHWKWRKSATEIVSCSRGISLWWYWISLFYIVIVKVNFTGKTPGMFDLVITNDNLEHAYTTLKDFLTKNVLNHYSGDVVSMKIQQ